MKYPKLFKLLNRKNGDPLFYKINSKGDYVRVIWDDWTISTLQLYETNCKVLIKNKQVQEIPETEAVLL